MQIIRTITGDAPPQSVGRINYHEHAFQVSPLLKGDELNNLAKSSREFARLKDSGFDAYVDATPIGLGRNIKAITQLRAETGLSIIHTTGVHREAHYASSHPVTELSTSQLITLFKYEIEVGLLKDDTQLSTFHGNTSSVCAGLIKFGIGFESISKFEARALEATATVSSELGVAVMVHLESGSAAHRVLDTLESFGCDASRVALAHLDRKPETILHCELASRGAYLGHDGAGRSKYWPDSTLISLFQEVAHAGLASQILLGGDVARSSRYIEYGGTPGLEYLGLNFIPKLRQASSDAIVDQVLTTNPQSWLAFTPPPTSA